MDLLRLADKAEVDSPFTRGDAGGLTPFQEAWSAVDEDTEMELSPNEG